jgi:hypothetical protein
MILNAERKRGVDPMTDPTPEVAEQFPIEWLLLDDLKPFPGNPRQNLEVDDLVASLRANGWERALVVWRAAGDDLPEGVEEGDVLIVAGHRTAQAARKLGLERAPCHDGGFPDLDHARAFNILDNRSGEKGEWDNDLLREAMKVIPVELQPLTAFSPPEVEKIRAGVPVEILAYMGDAPPPPELPDDVDSEDVDVPRPMFKLILVFEDEGEWRAACELAGAKGLSAAKVSASVEGDALFEMARKGDGRED